MTGVFLSGGFTDLPSATRDGSTLPVTEFGMVTKRGAWNPGRRY